MTAILVRKSNFEFLRVLSMLFIVTYHLLMWFVIDNPSQESMKAFWLPLHVGVICFVMISGFFGIKPTSKKIINLLGVFFVYSIPEIVYGWFRANTLSEGLHSLMFISQTHYWFVRTYLGLFLISPLVNSFLKHSTRGERWYVLIVTGVISIYLGNFAKYPLYLDGKNLVNFIFLYQVGHMLSEYVSCWTRIPIWKLLVLYAILNLLLVFGYIIGHGTRVGELLWRFSFPYSSPILLLNSVLLFMLVGKLDFTSRFVNAISAGMFSVYLIHAMTPMASSLERSLAGNLFLLVGNDIFFVMTMFVLALVVMFVCLFVNQLLYPIWKAVKWIGDSVYTKLGF